VNPVCGTPRTGFLVSGRFGPKYGRLYHSAVVSDPEVCPVFVWEAVNAPHGPIGLPNLNGKGRNRIRRNGELRLSHGINMRRGSVVFQPGNAANDQADLLAGVACFVPASDLISSSGADFRRRR
jgi:hypothetical protein